MKLTKTQKVLGVLVASSLLCIQCATTKRQKQSKQYSTNNVIKVYKSKKPFSGFVIEAFEDNEYKYNIPTTVYVNNTHFTNYNKPHGFDNVPSITVRVKNNQKHEVEVFSIGYLPTKKMEFFVKQGDSVVIKSYLKEEEIIINNYKKKLRR